MLGNLQHTVRIDEAHTGRPVWQSTLQTLHSVEWGRDYCDTSIAKVMISALPHIKEQLEPWRYLVSIYANDILVWQGPLYHLRATREGCELTARDPSVWWSRRRIAVRRNYLNRDATSVMRDLVTDAMGSDDPCKVVSFMVDESSGLWITKDIEPAVRMLSDEVGDLEDVGLGWTFSAGRLIVGPLASQHVTNTLTDQHMEADIAVEKDGAECVTDMLIQGKGVYGYHIDSERYVGLLQEVEKADSLVRAGECESLAKRRVEEAKYPPRRLDIGGDARLLPTAPISLDQLVPGALVPVSSSQTGITVSAVMMIKSISVTQDEGGDNVSLTLMEQPSALAPELMPQMVEADYNSPYDKDKREKEQTMPRDDSEMGYEDSEAIQPPLT